MTRMHWTVEIDAVKLHAGMAHSVSRWMQLFPHIRRTDILWFRQIMVRPIDKNAFKKAVEDSILVLADELDLDEADCYVKPEVEDDNEKLLAVD